MALGTALLVAQGLGSLGNYLIGRKQKREGEELARKGRADMLATAGPTQELLSGVDETKGLIKQGQARTRETLDSSVAGFLDALESGNQSTIGALTGQFAGNVAQAGSDAGLQAASAMAQANQPAIDAAERAMDVSRELAGFDFQTGTEAFNTGQQLIYDAAGQLLDIPMDLATLQTANPDAFANLFPNMGQDGIKVGQAGAYTGGGINSSAIRDLLAAMPERTQIERRDDKEEETEEEKRKREEQERIEAAKRGEATDTVDELINLGAMGGTMKPGDTFRTKGPEDHDKQEYNIVDAETGQTVAKTTGQEDHTVNEDGSMTVLNSDQSGSIHDAFKDVDVPMLLKFLEKYPQKGQVRELMSALNVFTLPQFQD
jgi:hypothetical protein